MPKLEVVNANNVIEFNPQKANFKLKNTGGPKGEPGAQGPKGDTGATGATGPAGPAGAAATIAVGTTTTGAEGTNASVTNSGTSSAAVFNFTIPKGDTGATGATGATGPQGPAGQDGADGFSPIATVTQEGLDAEISITDKDGTTTATVPGFGVQVVESLPATGSSNVIYLERDSNSASGNPISIADAVQAPLKSLDIQGNTAQQTYTGKNLLKLTPQASTSNGITATLTDGIINYSGTASSNWANIAARTYNSIPAGDYMLSMQETFTTNYAYAISVTYTDNTTATFECWKSVSNKRTVTLAKDVASYYVYLTGLTSGTSYSGTISLMLEAGSTATTPFEPYVGGTPAPNPDYPQAVQTVTGENVVKICGKNLFDKNSISTGYLNADGTLSSDQAYKTSDFIAVKPNTAYYKTYTASPRTKYYNSTRQPLNTTTYQDISIGGAAGTFTTPANAAYVRFSFPVAGINLDTTQLELGSTATAYEPYQGQSYEVNLGKNLFNPAIVVHPTGMPNNIGETLPVSTNTTYTFAVGNDRSFAQVQLFNASGTRTRTLGNGASDHTLTFTTTASEVSALFCFYPGQAGIDPTTYDYTGVQLELGSTATSYAAYFTPIELCKIGDYQDSIYKSGGKWYVHKETKRRNLADYKDLGWWASGSHVVKINWTLLGDSDFVKPTNKDTLGFMVSDYFTNTTANNLYNGIVNTGCAIGDDGLYFSNNDWSANTFKTFITDNTVYIYNPLATPTDTEITNEALIAQLEAILNGGTQGGANTITLTPSAWATGTLEVEYYDSYDSYLWVNNRWEKFAHLG